MREAFSLRSLPHVPLLIAAGVFALALFLILANPRAAAVHSPSPENAQRLTSSVMVAARPIAAGTVLAAADIRAKSLEGATPSGAMSSRESVIGRVAFRKFTAGETLFGADLRDASTLGIAAQVPQGERAFSIRVSEDEIVGGFLQSGDHVDVFATIPGSVFPANGAQTMPDRSQAVLLMQNVQVLAVGENPATRGSVQAGARTVTLSLPPAQLARLTLALRFGKVSLAVRKPGDNGMAGPADATLTDLIPPSAPSAPARHSVPGIPFYAGARGGLALAGGPP
jgi:pilus assembly protein CpaB